MNFGCALYLSRGDFFVGLLCGCLHTKITWPQLVPPSIFFLSRVTTSIQSSSSHLPGQIKAHCKQSPKNSMNYTIIFFFLILRICYICIKKKIYIRMIHCVWFSGSAFSCSEVFGKLVEKNARLLYLQSFLFFLPSSSQSIMGIVINDVNIEEDKNGCPWFS